jgi:formate hydrogenlyase subunit 3/multisubunit Na+/H+ antiporter MnhD subunit
MSDHQRETAFLRQCILYDDTEERHRLEEKITQIERDERIVRRAVWLMALLAALAMAGLGYVAIFLAQYPLNVSQLSTQFFVKALCAVGAGSLACLFLFLGLGAVYRRELDHHREDCRRLALKVLELRLGQPYDIPASKIAKEREMVVNGNGAAASASKESQVQDISS